MTLGIAALFLGVSKPGASEFVFLDRPGEPLPAPLVPHLPLVDFEIVPAAAPAEGFADGPALKKWLVGTIWEFHYQPNDGGNPSWLVRLRFHENSADFTWDGGSSWWCDSGSVAVLRHSSGDWTHAMRFADDYRSFTFDNTWGTLKLLGRAKQ